MRTRLVLSVALSMAVFFTLAAPTRHHVVLPPKEDPPQGPITSLDARRSMVVTDVALLEGFTFQRFLDTLIARSGVQGLTATQLYRQWLDTQNPKPGLADPAGPHCDDFVDDGQAVFNGFPRRCPTSEGILAQSGFTVCPAVLFSRVAHGDAGNIGLTAQEYEPKGKAAQEMIALYSYISRALYPQKERRREKKHAGSRA